MSNNKLLKAVDETCKSGVTGYYFLNTKLKYAVNVLSLCVYLAFNKAELHNWNSNI